MTMEQTTTLPNLPALALPHIVRERELGDDWGLTPSGILAPASYRPPKPVIAVDLFSGAGGMSLGIMQAGVQVMAACDSDPWAAITYLHNLGANPLQMIFLTQEDEKRFERALQREIRQREKQSDIPSAPVSGENTANVLRNCPPGLHGVPVFFFGDIRRLTGQMVLDALGKKRGEIDLVCGGPPCQGFSRAGKRNVMDPRNSLIFDFARLVTEIQPRTMVMEEVPEVVNMVTPDGLPVLDVVCRILEDGGMGRMDMLKKTLLATSGAGAIVRGKTIGPEEPEQDSALVQPALF